MRLVAVCLFLGICGAHAQNNSALVTFYSPGCKACGKETVRSNVTRSFERAYSGSIYDGSERLAHLSRNQFLTFRLMEGRHTFDVQNTVKFPTQQRLQTMLEPGKHYFVRIVILDRAQFPFRGIEPSLDLVDCSVASSESTNLKQLEANKVKVKALSELVVTPGFPNCGTP